MPLTTGSRLGLYDVVSLLGAGGMGEVYRARDSRLGRDVAIKVLPTFATDPERLARFEQEARAAAALNHPNVIAVHDLGRHARRLGTVSRSRRGSQRLMTRASFTATLSLFDPTHRSVISRWL